MSDQQKNTSDEMESGLDTGANLAGEAIKGLPRPGRGGGSSNSSSQGGGSPNSQQDVDPSNTGGPNGAPDNPDSPSPDGSDGNNQSGNSSSGADGSNAPDGGVNSPENGSNQGDAGSQENGQNTSDGNSGSSEGGVNQSGVNAPQNSSSNNGTDAPSGDVNGSSGVSDGGASSSAGASGAEAGASGAGAGAEAGAAGGSGAAAGSAGGAAGGGAAAGSGAAAAGGGAAAGGAAAGGAAAGGAAAGAAAGTVAMPVVGTAIGAVAGALLVPVLKFIGMAVATIAVFIAFFMMHPSFLYDNSNATNDRTTLENTYNYYYSHIQKEYKKDIEAQMSKALWKTSALSRVPITAANAGDVSLLYLAPTEYPYTKMSATDVAKIENTMASTEYEKVYFDANTAYLYTSDEYVEYVSSNINLVLCLIDVQKKHWFISLFDGIADTISGGYYSRFTDWVGRKWDGFWNDFVIYNLYSITVGEITEDTETKYLDGWDDAALTGADTSAYEEEIPIVTIEIVYTYDLKDLGVGYYANKLDLDEEQLGRAIEMSHYLADLFDSSSDVFLGWHVGGGYYTDAFQGGSVGTNISVSLENLSDSIDGMVYDPGGTHVFPLSGYEGRQMTSSYGPRDFALDPYHTGIDFGVPEGTPIGVVADGVVLFIGQMPEGFGNYIVVYHGELNGQPISTMYAHMSAFGTYRAGNTVNAGDVIGYVGETGLSTAPHLHFEVFVGTARRNPVEFFDFLSYLRPQ